jgi:hypothetical protein
VELFSEEEEKEGRSCELKLKDGQKKCTLEYFD